MVLKKTLESPLDCKEIQSVYPKEDQSWVFFGRSGVEAEIQYFGHLMQRADSFVKSLMLGKIEGRRRRGREDEMFGWCHQLNGCEFGWASGVGVEQGGLAFCSSSSCKESDTTE